ncbi:hypothetical protein O1157_03735 [Streptomyces albogriseolus]
MSRIPPVRPDLRVDEEAVPDERAARLPGTGPSPHTRRGPVA